MFRLPVQIYTMNVTRGSGLPEAAPPAPVPDFPRCLRRPITLPHAQPHRQPLDWSSGFLWCQGSSRTGVTQQHNWWLCLQAHAASDAAADGAAVADGGHVPGGLDAA